MPKLYSPNEFVTKGEKQLVQFLMNELPDDYHIYCNFEIPSGRGMFVEYDVVVIAPHAIYVIEDKYWHGKIIGNEFNIFLSSGESRKNPYQQATRQAKILSSYLAKKNSSLKYFWVEQIVHFSGDNVVIDIQGNNSSKMHTFETVAKFIQQPERLPVQQKALPLEENRSLVEACLKEFSIFNATYKREEATEFGKYKVIEKGDNQREFFNEYVVYDPDIGDQTRYLLREYFVDSKLQQADRAKQMHLIKNDYLTLERMSNVKGIIKPRYGFHPDSNEERFCVIYQMVTDVAPLDDFLLNEERLEESRIRKMFVQCLEILKEVHHHNVIHRNITPENILVTPDDTVYLHNFEFSRLGTNSSDMTILTSVLDEGLNTRYIPREWYGDYSKASKGSDLYALGRVFYDLLAGSDQEFPRENNGYLVPIEGVQDKELMQVIIDMSATYSKNWMSSAEEGLVRLIVEEDENKQKPAEFKVGAIIDNKYEIIKRLGQGGMSSVYKAVNLYIGTTYALKVMHNNPGSLEIAKAEYQKLIPLKHDNIVRINDIDTLGSNKAVILKMDYIEGKTLKQYLDSNVKLSIHQVMQWAKELLDALVYLQKPENKIVHADIKPGNVLINKENKAVLIDFNISRQNDDTSLVGITQRYSAPDVYIIKTDPSLDTYSLGYLIFVLMVGLEEHEISVEVLLKARPTMTYALAEWIVKATQSVKQNRFATPDDMLEELEELDHYTKPGIILNETKVSYDIIPSILEDYSAYSHRLIPNYQSLYSQSVISNAGTRGLDEFSSANYVSTRLDQQLPSYVLNGKSRLIIITGNAGDGKTAFIQSLERIIEDNGGQVIQEKNNGKMMEFNGGTVITNYDGSQDEDDLQNEEVLAKFFAQFKGDEPFSDCTQKETRIIAINEGRLMEFLSDNRFTGLLKYVESYLRKQVILDEHLAIINLNWRSIVAKDENGLSIVEKLLEKMANMDIVKNCTVCTDDYICPTCYNIQTLNDPIVGPLVKQRICTVFEMIHLRKKFHMTMRDIRSALSYIIYGTLSSKEISTLIKIGSPESLQKLHNLYYYNAIFNVEESTDRLMQELGKIDFANVIAPRIERQLSMVESQKQTLYMKKDFLYEDKELALLDCFFGYKYDDHAAISYFRHFVKASKRKYFYEHVGEEQLHLLPYKSYEKYNKLFKEENWEQELSTILRAISYLDGIRNPFENTLCFRDSKWRSETLVSMRVFPTDQFELRTNMMDVASQYIEVGQDTIRLVYKGSDRIKLDITLDIYEMLMKVLSGYIPSSQEMKGPFMNIMIFKRQLLSQRYEEIMLVQQEQVFKVMKTGEVIKIEKEIMI